MAARDFGGDDRLQIAARAHLQPSLERFGLAGAERMQAVHVHRPIADMVGVRRVQGHCPMLIIGNHTIGQRALGGTAHHPRQPRNPEKIASFRPEGQTRQQTG